VPASFISGVALASLGTSPTPGAQAVTVPSDAEGVIFRWSGYLVSNQLTSVSATFASGGFTIDQLPENGADAVGVAYARVTATGSQTITPVWGGTWSGGPVASVEFVKGIPTSGSWVRDTFVDHIPSASDTITGSVSSATDDVVLAGEGSDFGTLPASPSGWTSRVSTTVNDNYLRVSQADSPGAPTTTYTATAANSYPTLSMISVMSDTGGGQTLSPPLLTNTSTLYGPTVVRGAVTVAPPLLTNTSTLYGPTVVRGAVTLQPPLLTNTSTLYAPTVTQGPVTLLPPLLTNTSTLYAPTVLRGAVTLQPPLLTNTSTLYAPTVTAGAVLQPPLLTNTSVLYAPTVQARYTLSPPLLTNTSTLYAPTVAGGQDILYPPLLTNTSVLYAPTVTVGGVTVLVPLLTNISVLYPPVVRFPGANWTTIPTAQSPGWAAVQTAQSPDWETLPAASAGGWTNIRTQ
jgi:hypothetical protein